MADGGLLSLSWNNHKATFCHILSNLRERERYTDVTLACEGKFYPVHKLVLSTCSEYFESMFEQTPCKHPIVVLKDLKCDEVESLLSYMYAGVVNVAQNDLARLIKAAELLKVKGLAVPDEPPQDMDHHKRVSPVRNNSRDEAAFPPPKRRRRESDGTRDDHLRGANKSPVPSPPNSPYHVPDYHQDSSSRTSNSEEHRSERSIDRIEQELKGDVKPGGGDMNTDHQHHRRTPSRPSSPLQVVIEETLVKEEVIEPVSDDKDGLMNSGMDYGSISSDGRIDNPASDPTSQDHQMSSSKYDQQSLGSSSQLPPPPHHLSDSVMEALAGPSGMQGWLAGGGDLTGGFPGVEGYGADGRHLASQQGQGHPLELNEEGITSRLYNRGRRKYQCPFCTKASFKQTSDLKRHIRTHTGEKPFRCPFCDYRAAQSTNVKVHVSSKHNCVYRGPGTPRK